MIGTLVRQINESVKSYLSPARQDFSFPMTVSVEPDGKSGSLRKRETGRLVAKEEAPKFNGETKDFSNNGIAFIVPFIRLGGNYLVGEGRILNVIITLPNGNVAMQVTGIRYDPIGQHTSVPKYLVGAKIVTMTSQDRSLYEDYLRMRKSNTTELVLHITQN
jgi:hypothetical protein